MAKKKKLEVEQLNRKVGNTKNIKKHDDSDIFKSQQNTNLFCKGCKQFDTCDIGRISYVAGCHHNEGTRLTITKEKNTVKEKVTKQRSNLSADTSRMNDADYVKSLTGKDVVDFSRYELFKCNKKRKALGLESLRREM